MVNTWFDFFVNLPALAAFQIEGPIPSKKNEKNAWGGRVVVDRDVKQRCSDLTWDLRSQWVGRLPLDRVFVVYRLSVATDRQDADNMATTLQDCMVNAGILSDDNTKHLRQFVVLVDDAPGKLSRDRTPTARISIYPELPL
jgi:Holliday junction resolvase RusA-like endonuclease